MPWWAWLGTGIVLVGIELVGADLAFYLVFVGAAAMVVGIVEAAGAELPATGQWLGFAAVAIASMVLFRERLYNRLRAPGFDNAVAGAAGRVSVDEAVAAGGSTRVRLRGTEWDAANVGATAIAAGATARVVAVEGNVLQIVAEATKQPAETAGSAPEAAEDPGL